MVSTLIEKGYHHGALRTALLDAALELLGGDDAATFSLRAVARRAGVSAMAPYRHFPDKEALLAAVAAHGFEGLRAVLHAADAQTSEGALVAQAVAYLRYATENPALYRLMFGSRHFTAHPDLTAASEAAFAVLAARVAADTPADADLEARALGCWSFVHGLALLSLDGRLSDKLPALDADATRRVAEAMLAPSRGR